MFDDLYACADHLIASGVCDASHLGVMGGSNGGLLACVAALQRPTLFRAAVAQVPVTDMARFHMFTVRGEGEWMGARCLVSALPEVLFAQAHVGGVKACEYL